jgi:hypothetical protein
VVTAERSPAEGGGDTAFVLGTRLGTTGGATAADGTGVVTGATVVGTVTGAITTAGDIATEGATALARAFVAGSTTGVSRSECMAPSTVTGEAGAAGPRNFVQYTPAAEPTTIASTAATTTPPAPRLDTRATGVSKDRTTGTATRPGPSFAVLEARLAEPSADAISGASLTLA